MADFTFVPAFVQRLGDGEIDLTTTTGHVFKFMLTNTDPTTHDDKADLTPITGTGYSEVTITHTWTNVSGSTYRFAASADPVWSATGADWTTFQYVVLFDENHANDALVGFFNNGSGINLTNGNDFTLNLDANFEIFTLAPV